MTKYELIAFTIIFHMLRLLIMKNIGHNETSEFIDACDTLYNSILEWIADDEQQQEKA